MCGASDSDTKSAHLPAEVEAVQAGDDGLRIEPQLMCERRARRGHDKGPGMELDLVTEPGWFTADKRLKC
jgi:hypothetical protein